MEPIFWQIDPTTLRDVIIDRDGYRAAFEAASDDDLIWLLRLDNRLEEAESFGRDVLAQSGPRFRTLLLLAHVLQWRGEFAEAASLQERALLQARTPESRATALQHIGKRQFDEGDVDGALVSFEEALDLRQSADLDASLIASTTIAIDRCHQLQAGVSQS